MTRPAPVPKKKQADCIGRQRLEDGRGQIEQGNPPFNHKLVGICLAGAGTRLHSRLPDDYAEWPGEPVVAEVADMAFRPSAHPSARELARRNAGGARRNARDKPPGQRS